MPALDAYYRALPVALFPVSPQHRVIHIHVPKTAGTSIRVALFGSDVVKHVRAGEVEAELWQALPSLAVVRHPLQRFVSNYRFHCLSGYDGVLARKHPDLKELSIGAYCDRFLQDSPLLAPQVAYLARPDTDKRRVDHLIRFEELPAALETVWAELGLAVPVTHLKAGPPGDTAVPPEVVRAVEAAYAADYEMLGY